MGSFNVQCAVSGLPICDGDPARLFFIYEKEGSWYPYTISIKGQYDSYGRITDYDDTSAEAILVTNFLRSNVIERTVGDNTCHDVAVSASGDLNHFIEAAWEERLQVGHHSRFNSGLKLPELVYTLQELLGSRGLLVGEWEQMNQARIRTQYGEEDKLDSVVADLSSLGYSVQLVKNEGPYGHGRNQLIVTDGKLPATRRLFFMNIEPTPIRYVLVREDVWQSVLKQQKLYNVSKISAKVDEIYNKVTTEAMSVDFNGHSEDLVFKMMTFDKVNSKVNYDDIVIAVNDCMTHVILWSMYTNVMSKNILSGIARFALTFRHQPTPELIESYVLQSYLCNDLSKTYTPLDTSSEGADLELRYTMHEKFYSSMKKLATAAKRQYKEYCDE